MMRILKNKKWEQQRIFFSIKHIWIQWNSFSLQVSFLRFWLKIFKENEQVFGNFKEKPSFFLHKSSLMYSWWFIPWKFFPSRSSHSHLLPSPLSPTQQQPKPVTKMSSLTAQNHSTTSFSARKVIIALESKLRTTSSSITRKPLKMVSG